MSMVVSSLVTRDYPPPSGCQEAPVYPRPQTLGWHPNTCDTFWASPFIRQEEPRDLDGAREWWEEGYTELLTNRPVRMHYQVGRGDGYGAADNGERCRYYAGNMMLDNEGYAVALFGVEPTASRQDRTNAIGYPMIASEDYELLEAGYCYFVGGYETSTPTEVHVFSTEAYCKVIE